MTPEGDLLLRAVDSETWRGVADLRVHPSQREFVTEPSRYLALCCYGTAGWRPLAVLLDGEVIGFLMWTVDPADGACWLGGIIVDRSKQGRGYGRRAVRAAIDHLAETGGHGRFALSYEPGNTVARSVYAAVGFTETGEREGNELVARLELAVTG